MKELLILLIFQSVLSIHGAVISNEVSSICKLSAYPPHPKTGCCGIDDVIDNRIVGGEPTDLRQYPWLAQVHYKNNLTRPVGMLCGGFLISGRYVVSAAHCFEKKSKYRPYMVKLGDYDSETNGPDCVYVHGEKDCVTALNVPIDKVIIHGFYNPTYNHHDIALIRLKYTVNFTDTIRPICLPTSDITEDPNNENLRLYAAGWGITRQVLKKNGEYEDFDNPIKMHVDLPLRDITHCSNPYRKLFKKLQVCAGGETGKDACMGDSGGPLMYDNAGVYDAIGIVSYGASAPCGEHNNPGVYTKVMPYRNWILKNIRRLDY